MEQESSQTRTSTDTIEQQGEFVAGGVVVGIDGSLGSKRALEWAATQVERFGLITPVASWNFPWWGVTVSPLPGAIPPSVLEYEERARFEAEKTLEGIDSEIQQPLVLSWSSAGQLLCEVSENANLLVVGTRGRSALSDTFLGSTSMYVAGHSKCPVAVVPAEAPTHGPQNRVVVGLDGSANSFAALAWALENTPSTSELLVVHIWNFATENPEGENAPRTRANLGHQARENLRLWVDQVTSEHGSTEAGEPRKITQLVEYGDPRLVLQSYSNDADLLILGTRGHRGVAHLLLGSVTTSILHHPFTTVVVVPADGSK